MEVIGLPVSDVVLNFLHMIGKDALLMEKITGIPGEIFLAQAALETGWGRYVKGNNFYGIKDLPWIEGSQEFWTHEYIDGKKISTKAKFEKFDSPLQAMAALVVLLKHSPRYKEAYKAAINGKVDEYFEKVQEAGYATDPQYAEKLKAIVRMLPSNWRDLVW